MSGLLFKYLVLFLNLCIMSKKVTRKVVNKSSKLTPLQKAFQRVEEGKTVLVCVTGKDYLHSSMDLYKFKNIFGPSICDQPEEYNNPESQWYVEAYADENGKPILRL
jgi:hypothetical protein